MSQIQDVPSWAKGAIFYQLFVDRFNKGESHPNNLVLGRNYRNWGDEVNWHRDVHGNFHNNDYFCGDLDGIREKIPYFKSLGVQVLYLSPINFSGYRYERYASTNHMIIDPDVGTFEDLDNLHQTALANDMHIILDIAFNHCNVDNLIYKDACENVNSQYHDWFKRDKNGSICFWYGFRDMPEFNQFNEGYQNYVYGPNGVIELYSKYVDGFRLDLAENLEPFFIEGIKNKANEKTPHLIVGEYWRNVEKDVIGNGLDSPTCYPLTNAILKFLSFNEMDTLERVMHELVSIYPQNTVDSLLVSLDTHDIIRAITILGKSHYMRHGYMDIWKVDEYPSPWHRDGLFYTDEFRQFEYNHDGLSDVEYARGCNLLKIGAIIQYFYLGSPCIYYGTEAGLYGWKDPFNRKCYPWGHEDMNLLNYFKGLGQFRNKFHSTNANPNVIYFDRDIFSFTRKNNENAVFVAVNRSTNERTIAIPEEFSNGERFELNVSDHNKLMPFGGLIILNSR